MIRKNIVSEKILFRFAIPVMMVAGIGFTTVNQGFAQQPEPTSQPAAASAAGQGAAAQANNNPPAGMVMTPAVTPAAAPATASAPATTPVAQNGAVAPATPAAAAAPKATVDYGLADLWVQGDIVSRLTLIIMAIMSIGSWYVIVMKVIGQARFAKAAKEVGVKRFWQQPTLRQGMDMLQTQSAYRYLAENGIDSVTHYQGGLQENIDLYSWVSMALHRALDTLQARLQNGLAFLGTVGSTAPFVGLFGTVWGIHHALSAISIAGQATLDKVAGPVGEALIMTAIGLATAVPAVLGYNYLIRRNKVLMGQARNFTADVQTVLLGGNLRNKPEAADKAADKGK